MTNYSTTPEDIKKRYWSKLFDAAGVIVEAANCYDSGKRPTYFTAGESRNIRRAFADLIIEMMVKGEIMVPVVAGDWTI